MNPSRIFIERPVATTLLTIGVALAGAISFRLLPVSPLPAVDFPTISVSASLPGASPETMASTVATPLERALGQISDITEMTSSSTLGSTRVTLQFALYRDIDGAARDVQAAINNARTLLPVLPSNPTYRKINPADAPILILALTSDTMTRGQLYDAADTILAQKLSQVHGVGQASVTGSSQPAVRVELNPTTLNRYSIGTEAVRTAITLTNANRPKGAIEAGDNRWQIGANDQALTAREYRPIVVTYQNGAPVRLDDVAQVVDSIQDLHNAGFSDGKPSVTVLIFRQPNANIIDTVDRVKQMLPQLEAAMPKAINLKVVIDRTPPIRASLREVEQTLGISVILVVLVVFLFLRRATAALVPAVAVPVSLIGTFGLMYLAGFSLDNLSLMALTIATGFVVDDAVVVLENISRHVEEGMKPMEAALKGAREVGFTVLSMSISLVAVFIPILMMGGIVGRLFREFALTLSAAIGISLVLSLSTTPMMCAYLLKPHSPDRAGGGLIAKCSASVERLFEGMLHGYDRTLQWALRHGRFMMILLLATICLNVYLYVIIPKAFFPQQDVGRLSGNIQGDQSISFDAMQDKLKQFMTIVRADPAVVSVVGSTGGGQTNTGQMFISLKPLSDRKASADQVIARLRGKLARVPGATLYLQAQQDIRIGGRASNAQYQYTLQADDLAVLRSWEIKIRNALTGLPQLTDVNTDAQDKGVKSLVVIDRDAASRLGVNTLSIDTALNNLFGQRQVSTIYNPMNQYRVVMEADPSYSVSALALQDVYITGVGPTGLTTIVPLSAIAHYEMQRTPLAVNHQGQFPASTISFGLPLNVSLSQATDAIQQTLVKLGVPTSVRGSFQGTAKAFQDSLSNEPLLILAALVTVYIVLGVLYESYVHPLTILSTLPSAGVGALLALLATGTEFSIIALIGVILLIGIVKKNAIMMIDFALEAERARGISPRAAIQEACLKRFRPIMMTTMAALFGALPLALRAGDGAELRRPLGISIAGGLIVSQLLTLYTTPLIYVYLDRFQAWYRRKHYVAHPRPSGFQSDLTT
jgi:multidrug efflux pump